MFPTNFWFILLSGEDLFFKSINRNKNYKWWPCLLMVQGEMSNLYRGPSVEASYQVLVQLENHCSGHKPKSNVRVVKCKLHTLVILEYCYWWNGSWLLERLSNHIWRIILSLIFLCCRLQGEWQSQKQTC
jgi:hypothetical protein